MTWIQTRHGHAFDLLEPAPEMVDFRDVAEALSRIARFSGHTVLPYSVAEHSCRVCDAVDLPYRAHALLHDAHEAYLGDWTTPLKQALHHGRAFGALDRLVEIELRAMRAVHAAAGVAFPPDEAVMRAVREADLRLLATERRDLMAPCPRPWDERVETAVPLARVIRPWPWARAADEFRERLARYAPGALRAAA